VPAAEKADLDNPGHVAAPFAGVCDTATRATLPALGAGLSMTIPQTKILY
jgi:hypothetical protein